MVFTVSLARSSRYWGVCCSLVVEFKPFLNVVNKSAIDLFINRLVRKSSRWHENKNTVLIQAPKMDDAEKGVYQVVAW